MTLVKRVSPGEMIPPLYGVAWYDFATDRVIALPVGLNTLVRVLRAAWVWVRFGGTAVRVNPREAYAQGVRAGRKQLENRR